MNVAELIKINVQLIEDGVSWFFDDFEVATIVSFAITFDCQKPRKLIFEILKKSCHQHEPFVTGKRDFQKLLHCSHFSEGYRSRRQQKRAKILAAFCWDTRVRTFLVVLRRGSDCRVAEFYFLRLRKELSKTPHVDASCVKNQMMSTLNKNL